MLDTALSVIDTTALSSLLSVPAALPFVAAAFSPFFRLDAVFALPFVIGARLSPLSANYK